MAPARAPRLALLAALAALLHLASPAAALPGARARLRVPPSARAAARGGGGGGAFSAQQAAPRAPLLGTLTFLADTDGLPLPDAIGLQPGSARDPGDRALAAASKTFDGGESDGPKDGLEPGDAFGLEGLPSAAGVPEGPPADGELLLALKGLNQYDQRYSGVGQGPAEPPDQGICAGKGYVMETVNMAVRVFRAKDGKPLTAATSINKFLGVRPAYDPQTQLYGPTVFDPSCFFEPRSKRFIHVVALIGYNTDGTPDGTMYTVISISKSSNPAKKWRHWSLDGVRNSGCSGGPCCAGGCFADYPQASVTADAIVLATNEFSSSTDVFYGVNIYVLPYRALLNNNKKKASIVYWDRVNNGNSYHVLPAVRPADMPFKLFSDDLYLVGTGYTDTNTSDFLQLYTVHNVTASMSKLSKLPGSATGVYLTTETIPVHPYWNDDAHWPGYAPQTKPFAPKEAPLLCCVRNTTTIPECLPIVDVSQEDGGADIPYISAGPLALNGLAIGGGGKLWALQGRMVDAGGDQFVGIGWYVITPENKTTAAEGTLSVAGAHLLFPTVAISGAGAGAGYIGFSMVGDAHFPSAGYVAVNANGPYGNAVVSGEGAAPQDGFTGYPTLSGSDSPLSRWGDYGASAVDEKGVAWLANVYIGGRCTLDSWAQKNYSCGGARSGWANWGTHLTKLAPAAPI